ncbi:hypothetical protein OAB39_03140 [Amylibacter sp.]|nr:hypothetical protein [Amylibacter sp.]
MKNDNTLIFLQLNEINFDLVSNYIENGVKLKNFEFVLNNFNSFNTTGEMSYEQLEPWIQWTSVYTGKTYEEHQIFRLGDTAIGEPVEQIFEILEINGKSVGSISPMNAINNLNNPAYFIPDPWTDTNSDGSDFSKKFTNMLRQTVNDNAEGKLSKTSITTILNSIYLGFSLKGLLRLVYLAMRSRKSKWSKALFLDQLIHMVHLNLLAKAKPDFSSIFLNAGAHVQHHYFFNAKWDEKLPKNPEWYVANDQDPILDMLKSYDKILGDYLKLSTKGNMIFIATGLSQIPYNKAKYYYRLKNHREFLSEIGIHPVQIHARMTRDFDLKFLNETTAKNAQKILENVVMEKDSLPIFSDYEIRGSNLFVSLSYPNEITNNDNIKLNNRTYTNFLSHVAFVAIKNGMHSERGYCYFSDNCSIKLPQENVHVADVFHMIKECFDLKK